MAPSTTTINDHRRVVSVVGGGGAMFGVDSGELIRESGRDSLCERHAIVPGKNGPRPRRRLTRQRSCKENINHFAAETYLISRLAFTLLQYLGVGYSWITQLLALGCYALLLMPGFLQVAYHYFFSKRVKRSVIYGNMPRNRMDLYLPANICEPKPVLIFVTGGAWIIGYKAWGSFLGLQLAERDIIVASIDYRNFPQGTISDMVKDVSQGISFIVDNVADYGGDPNRIYLMGQSAGAHISACALLDQAIRESGNGESVSWSISQIKAYFGLSGGIMEGEQSLRKFSPEVKVLDSSFKDATLLLPPIILFHGSDDRSIPSESSKKFADALTKVGARTELVLYDGKTHTDLFVQDPLRGGKDDLFEHMVYIIHAGDDEALAKDATAPPRRRLVPEVLIKLASKISPF
ncbi:isoprenylcysteine alpha-carbonyl methylesterase ICME isoform X2 [Neltuma alba]|uniref:isoprenylcysteine alpha-carbonyl methylesterase ICME isoform X2 n=1 Tax=Neltuma alba TaxID=207710 RepID=UPI0010A30DD5|nr:isoprenylcysteine alpha-carbonyl methylesterase ICME-like isoform X2 [Prosopis alba]